MVRKGRRMAVNFIFALFALAGWLCGCLAGCVDVWLACSVWIIVRETAGIYTQFSTQETSLHVGKLNHEDGENYGIMGHGLVTSVKIRRGGDGTSL